MDQCRFDTSPFRALKTPRRNARLPVAGLTVSTKCELVRENLPLVEKLSAHSDGRPPGLRYRSQRIGGPWRCVIPRRKSFRRPKVRWTRYDWTRRRDG